MLRLLEMGIEPFLIANSLIAVIAQRLVRRNCPQCSRQDEQQSALLAQWLGEGAQAWRGMGCVSCHEVGFSGRVALHEVWLLDEADRQAILERRGTQGGAESIRFRSMWEDGLAKVKAGLTTLDEIQAATVAAKE